MSELHLIGGGDQASVVADAAHLAGVKRIVLWAERPPDLARFPAGTEARSFGDLTPDRAVILAIGDLPRRRELRARFPRIAPPVIHPAAIVSPSARIGDGTVALARCVVNANARVEEDVILNTGAIVEHDCRVGANTHVAPGAILAGEALVGRDSHIGAGSIVLEDRTVGDGATVGAGAVVTRNVADGVTVVGVPARPMAR